eukprot:CAMPEP_0184874008 /NCGR_PEP_ID=MMETSP0580-20130426/42156_1 /TAXON_ID=1118495 /ORGANISM="Dactyliosolen fragilissimus" /LENGTH=563 /DNA_ID=CAMNT_0027376973 /DNA_START=94 /DNA_END=1785 /DNA_ORIENTATION=+
MARASRAIRRNYNRLLTSIMGGDTNGSNINTGNANTNHSGVSSPPSSSRSNEENTLNAPLALHDHDSEGAMDVELGVSNRSNDDLCTNSAHSNTENDNNPSNNNNSHNSNNSVSTTSSSSNSQTKSSSKTTRSYESVLPPIVKERVVIILDPAQKKFEVKVDASWNVLQLKRAGCDVHKVSPKAQRLILMGRLLKDEDALEECGINEDEKIVHLFPKPNIIITNSSSSEANSSNTSPSNNNNLQNTTNNNNTIHDNSNSDDNAAHVPQIVIDASEAENRSNILVLSSQEIFEAQHHIKLISFILMVYCGMILLSLLPIMVGSNYIVDDDQYYNGIPFNDAPATNTPSSNHDEYGTDNITNTEEWKTVNYADLVISSLGFYCGLLGMKAATESTVALAKRFFYLLLLVGISWNIFFFLTQVWNIEEFENSANHDNSGNSEDGDNSEDSGNGTSGDEGEGDNTTQITTDQIYTLAATQLILPLVLWIFCFLRALQFQQLLEEAEEEANQRNLLLTQDHNDEDEDGDFDVNNNSRNNVNTSINQANVDDVLASNDLELQVGQRSIS